MSLVSVCPARYADVVEIARRMRDMDAEEIWPVTIARTAETLALGTVAGEGYKFVARYGAVPVATWGATPTRPGVVSVWMYSTDQWPKVALTVTRHIRRELIPCLINDGCVRAECWSHSGHHVAHKWLGILGAVREATLEDYGINRVPYHCFSWTQTRLEREGKYNVCWPVGSQITIHATNGPSSSCARAATNEG